MITIRQQTVVPSCIKNTWRHKSWSMAVHWTELRDITAICSISLGTFASPRVAFLTTDKISNTLDTLTVHGHLLLALHFTAFVVLILHKNPWPIWQPTSCLKFFLKCILCPSPFLVNKFNWTLFLVSEWHVNVYQQTDIKMPLYSNTHTVFPVELSYFYLFGTICIILSRFVRNLRRLLRND